MQGWFMHISTVRKFILISYVNIVFFLLFSKISFEEQPLCIGSHNLEHFPGGNLFNKAQDTSRPPQ